MIATLLLVQLQMFVCTFHVNHTEEKQRVNPHYLGTAPVNTQSLWKFNQGSEPCKIVLGIKGAIARFSAHAQEDR